MIDINKVREDADMEGMAGMTDFDDGENERLIIDAVTECENVEVFSLSPTALVL